MAQLENYQLFSIRAMARIEKFSIRAPYCIDYNRTMISYINNRYRSVFDNRWITINRLIAEFKLSPVVNAIKIRRLRFRKKLDRFNSE